MSTLRDFVQAQTKDICDRLDGLQKEVSAFQKTCAGRHGNTNIGEMSRDVDRLKQTEKKRAKAFWLAMGSIFAAAAAGIWKVLKGL